MATSLARVPNMCGGCQSRMHEYVERSCPGCGRVSLHDVEDAEAFVQATINKGGLRLTPEQRDELAAHGMFRLVEMARKYQPGRGGLDAETSRFSGFAAKYLPGKLSDHWHRMNDGHYRVDKETDTRVWVIEVAPASLDRIASEHPLGLESVKALHHSDEWEPELLEELPRMLTDEWERQCELVTKYVEMRTEGYSCADFELQMNLTSHKAAEIERITKRMIRKAQPDKTVLMAA